MNIKPVLNKKSGETIPIPPEDFTYEVNEHTGTVTVNYLKTLDKGDTILWNIFYEVVVPSTVSITNSPT